MDVGRPMHRGGPAPRGLTVRLPVPPGRDGTREEVVAQYRAWPPEQPELLIGLPCLRGKRLGC